MVASTYIHEVLLFFSWTNNKCCLINFISSHIKSISPFTIKPKTLLTHLSNVYLQALRWHHLFTTTIISYITKWALKKIICTPTSSDIASRIIEAYSREQQYRKSRYFVLLCAPWLQCNCWKWYSVHRIIISDKRFVNKENALKLKIIVVNHERSNVSAVYYITHVY